jgi:hypothetical protein
LYERRRIGELFDMPLEDMSAIVAGGIGDRCFMLRF